MAWFEYPSAQMGSEAEVIGRRLAAFGIDLLLVGGGILAVGRLIATLDPPHARDLWLAFNVVFGLAYFIYLEGSYGQTVGKTLVNVVVVTEDGQPIDYAKAAGRTFLRFVDWILFVGLISMLLTERHQRPGDMSADTVVVRALGPAEPTDE